MLKNIFMNKREKHCSKATNEISNCLFKITCGYFDNNNSFYKST